MMTIHLVHVYSVGVIWIWVGVIGVFGSIIIWCCIWAAVVDYGMLCWDVDLFIDNLLIGIDDDMVYYLVT